MAGHLLLTLEGETAWSTLEVSKGQSLVELYLGQDRAPQVDEVLSNIVLK